MVFVQLASGDSIRDIEACLSANPSKFYRLGIRCRILRSTLADANERRDARIFEEFGTILIAEARRLYAEEAFFPELNAAVYALDSATVTLSTSNPSLGPPAARRTKSPRLEIILSSRGLK